MQSIIDGIRKLVVLVLVMELVIQLSPGKQYEPYVKILIGIMVVYSLSASIFGAISGLENTLEPMEERIWSGSGMWEIQEHASEITKEQMQEITEKEQETQYGLPKLQVRIAPVLELHLDDIKIEPINPFGGTP